MTKTYAHLRVQQPWKSLSDPKTVSNSPRNRQESAKIASANDGHVNAPSGLSIVEIALGPQKVSNSPWKCPESNKTKIVGGQHINAPRGALIVEIAPGPQNNE